MNGNSLASVAPVDEIARSIVIVRGHKVVLDTALASLYSTTTKRFNEQVRRNKARFPPDFMFQLTPEEAETLRSHFATSNENREKRGGRRYLPYVFTEHGAIMAATILNSQLAVEMSVYVVRAFVKLRELVSSNGELAQKLAELERSLAALDKRTQHQFKEVYDAIRALMTPPIPRKRPIGFTADISAEVA